MPKLTVGKSWQRLWPRKLSIVRTSGLLLYCGEGEGVCGTEDTGPVLVRTLFSVLGQFSICYLAEGIHTHEMLRELQLMRVK